MQRCKQAGVDEGAACDCDTADTNVSWIARPNINGWWPGLRVANCKRHWPH